LFRLGERFVGAGFSLCHCFGMKVGAYPINSKPIVCFYIRTMKNHFLMKKNGSKSLSPAVGLPKCPAGLNGFYEIAGGGIPRGPNPN
jgi:hypothetical protein